MTDKAIRIPPIEEITHKDISGHVFIELGGYSLLFYSLEQMKAFQKTLGCIITKIESTRTDDQIRFDEALEHTMQQLFGDAS